MSAKQKRDLSKAQLGDALRKDGWVPEFAGYWYHQKSGVSVYPGNAGPRRRERLRYMKAQLAEIMKAKLAQIESSAK